MTERPDEAFEADAGTWREAADVVIDHLAAVAVELPLIERAVLAALLAPAIVTASEEVRGFDAPATTLPEGVDIAVRQHGLRVIEPPPSEG